MYFLDFILVNLNPFSFSQVLVLEHLALILVKENIILVYENFWHFSLLVFIIYWTYRLYG